MAHKPHSQRDFSKNPDWSPEEVGCFLGAIVSSGGDALLGERQVRRLIGDISTATLYRMIATGAFPKSIPVTDGRKAWSLKRVQTWINEKIRSASDISEASPTR